MGYTTSCTFTSVRPIQIVMDEDLLVDLDRSARRKRQSRSAFIRSAVAEVLRRQHYLELAERERLAYARKPVTPAERAGVRRMQRGSDRSWASQKERW